MKGAWPVRTLGFVATAVLISVLAGCNEAQKQPDPVAERLASLEQQNAQQAAEIEGLKGANASLRRNLEVLSGLPDKTSLEDLCRLESVSLTRYTGFYDKDEDGVKEALIVYVQPVDQQGDVVKAPGAVEISLWDLSQEPDGARLGQWRVGPKDLQKLWFSTLMRTNYRLVFDAPAGAAKTDKPLTVKITFTDCLTGQVFDNQCAIEPSAE